MAKKGRKRPPKRGKFSRKESDESKKVQTVKDRKKEVRQHKSLTRQVRGMKWDPEEFDEEFEGDE